MIIHLEGKPVQGAALPLTSDGVQFGRGVFETLASLEDGRVFLLERHLTRLTEGMKAARITRRLIHDEVKTWLRAILKEAGPGPKRVKIMAFSEGIWLSAVDLPKPEKGPWKLMSHQGPRGLFALKATAYLESLLAWEQAREQGCQEALLCNHHGAIYEGSRSNFFWIEQGKLYTKEQGVLPGTVRGFLIGQSPMGLHYGSLRTDQLDRIEGAFATNATMGIMPVSLIDHYAIPLSPQIDELRDWLLTERQRLAEAP